MAALNQDFVTYAGDDVSPVFTVLNASGVAVDISAVTEITWKALNEDGTVVLTKTKTGGGIVFSTSGADGKFVVTLTKTDTALLSGYYQHEASIKDVANNITTVTVGRMQVGLVPTWTYNPAQLTTNNVYQVRRLIGDTKYADQQMQDQEIQWYVDNYGNVWTAAANCARALAAEFSRLVDTVQGELRTLYGQKAKNYFLTASQLELQGKARGGVYVLAGGISVSDKESQVADTDRVAPQFNIEMFDNLLPTSPVGHEVPGSQAPEAFP